MNPAAEVQNFAVLFRFHKFQSIDPLSMNGRAMNWSRPIHRCCTYVQAAQPYFCEFWIVFLLESSDVLMAAGWYQTAGHHRHPFCVFFQKRFELSILNILNVNLASHCLNLPPLEFKTTWTAAPTLTQQPTDSHCLCCQIADLNKFLSAISNENPAVSMVIVGYVQTKPSRKFTMMSWMSSAAWDPVSGGLYSDSEFLCYMARDSANNPPDWCVPPIFGEVGLNNDSSLAEKRDH
jgi:hypothetical protein